VYRYVLCVVVQSSDPYLLRHRHHSAQLLPSVRVTVSYTRTMENIRDDPSPNVRASLWKAWLSFVTNRLTVFPHTHTQTYIYLR
jgi:hypothetical protein